MIDVNCCMVVLQAEIDAALVMLSTDVVQRQAAPRDMPSLEDFLPVRSYCLYCLYCCMLYAPAKVAGCSLSAVRLVANQDGQVHLSIFCTAVVFLHTQLLHYLLLHV